MDSGIINTERGSSISPRGASKFAHSKIRDNDGFGKTESASVDMNVDTKPLLIVENSKNLED